MTREFEFILPNTGRVLLIWVGGLALGIAAAAVLAPYTEHLNRDMVFVLLLVLLLGGGFTLFRLTKKFGGRPTLVTLAAEQLAVLDQRTGQERRIGFAEIDSYRFSAFNGAEELRIKTKDGRKQKIAINTNLHDDQSLVGLVQEFEAALALHQPAAGGQSTVVREKTFFEKKISTVVLVVLASGMAWAVWKLVVTDVPVRGSMLTAFASFIAYAVAWYNARERRGSRQ